MAAMQCRVVHDYTADANRCNTAARISYTSNEKEPKTIITHTYQINLNIF